MFPLTAVEQGPRRCLFPQMPFTRLNCAGGRELGPRLLLGLGGPLYLSSSVEWRALQFYVHCWIEYCKNQGEDAFEGEDLVDCGPSTREGTGSKAGPNINQARCGSKSLPYSEAG